MLTALLLQDSLLDTNEKLRASLHADEGARGANAPPGSDHESGLQQACLELFQALVDSESVVEHCERLVSQVRRLTASCQAALDGKEVPSFSEWESATHNFPRLPFEKLFSHGGKYILLCLANTGHPRSSLPLIVDASGTREVISSEIGIVAELKAEINERIAASLGEACVTQ
jgi:hypothetical protein